MALGCGGSCMKCLLIIFNIFFFVCGGVLLGTGLWLLIDPEIQMYLKDVFPDGADPLFRTSIIVLIAIGALTFIIGFLGCCGACKESPCMLSTFAALLVVILIGEITAGILAFVFRNELGEELKNEMDKEVYNVTLATGGDISPTSSAWHFMQHKLSCCGSSNYKDYKATGNFNDTFPVPLSCCVLQGNDLTNPKPVDKDKCYSGANGITPPDPAFLHTKGCYNAIYNLFTDKSALLIGFGIALGLIQILGVVFACCVKKEIEKSPKNF